MTFNHNKHLRHNLFQFLYFDINFYDKCFITCNYMVIKAKLSFMLGLTFFYEDPFKLLVSYKLYEIFLLCEPNFVYLAIRVCQILWHLFWIFPVNLPIPPFNLIFWHQPWIVILDYGKGFYEISSTQWCWLVLFFRVWHYYLAFLNCWLMKNVNRKIIDFSFRNWKGRNKSHHHDMTYQQGKLP